MSVTLFDLAGLGADSSADVGAKALHLGALIAAGCPVPEGFVLPCATLAAVVAGDRSARERLLGRAAALGDRLVVRSSASLEDRPGSAAPGLFSSVIDVAADAVVDAAVAVARSAETAAVRAYRSRTDAPPVRMAAIVQRHVPPDVAGVVYTRGPDGQPGGIIESHGPDPWRVRIDPDRPPPAAPGLTSARIAELWQLALRAQRAIGADGGADVEWVASGDVLWLVQARAIVRRHTVSSEVLELLAFSRGDERLWRLDVGHNPDPMSPAQIGLVERVAPHLPFASRVVGGYLYTSTADPAPANPAPVDLEPPALATLRARIDALSPAMERALEPLERDHPAHLTDALRHYDQLILLYSRDLAPVVAAVRGLAGDTPGGRHPFGRALARAARGTLSHRELLRLLAPASPAWDVAVPTYGERPELIERAIERYRRRPDPPEPADDGTAYAAEIAELDDLWFFRAQAGVRRSMLAVAERWGLGDRDDIFFLDLERVIADADAAPELDAVRGAAGAARARRRERQALSMPLAFRDGAPVASPPPRDVAVWRGRGAGGVASGPVRRVGELGSETDVDGAVLVTQATTPATLLLAIGATALVCDHGGLLSHAAAMARELGIPCVVGCRGAWRDLADGDHVLVDGTSGLVVRGDAPNF